MEYISHSEEETYAFAEEVARESKPGDILALQGDLGSGKTTFVKGLAKAFNIKKEVTSPTFVFLKQYPVEKREIKSLVHVDCYRINSKDDAESIGLLEFMSRRDMLLLIEWPERIKDLLPEQTKFIRFEYIDEKTRKISKDF